MFLRSKIIVSLFVFAFTVLAALLFAYNQTQQVKESQALVNNTNSVLKKFKGLVGGVFEAQTAQRGYIITSRSTYLKRYNTAKQEIYRNLSTVKELTESDSKAQSRISDMEKLLAARVLALDETVSIYQRGGFDKAKHYVGADNTQDSLEKFILSVESLELYEHDKLSRRMQLTEKRSNHLLVSIGVLGLLSFCALFALIVALKKYAEDTEKLSLTDELTGILNRRGFFTLLAPVLKVAKRQKADCSLVFVDMDGLKTINDTLGHDVGSEAIKGMAQVLKQTFRSEDLIARYGGDEFLVFAYGTTESSVDRLEERFEESISKYTDEQNLSFKLSASLGFTTLEAKSVSVEKVKEAVNSADLKMYERKKSKRST